MLGGGNTKSPRKAGTTKSNTSLQLCVCDVTVTVDEIEDGKIHAKSALCIVMLVYVKIESRAA